MKKFLSLILALSLMLSVLSSMSVVSADDLSDRRAAVQRELDEIESKLDELGSQSRETEEYLETLERKIKYLTEQYELAKSEVKTLESKAVELENSISSNEKELEKIKVDVVKLQDEIDVLSEEFNESYELYCQRIRAMYVSGSFDSVLVFLIEGGGIQDFLTRLEMVRAVSKRDGELMENVRAQTTEIVEIKQKLDDKNKSLGEKQKKLKKDKEYLKVHKAELLEKQDSMLEQQAVIEDEQLKANSLLKELNEKTQEYGEYRDITQEELDEIDADIEEAARKYREQHTTTTTTTTTTTEKNSGGKTSTTTTTTTTAAPSGDYISLTYPCPTYTTITCGFGDYEGHTGCDFSTRGNENQRIVASESGTVILVRLLERSYGHYLVIMLDKTTPSGKLVYTLYAHNNDIIVSEGQHVEKGQQIARSGNTGNSTGPHCHFEVRVGGSSQSCAVNPAYYLP
ncbi:MAG: peptidoglycan DD-metalloendopeptidase family protein [Eubacterium sp.]|nr:peptidoglycan DD-metalloendopeptidase family protein [Eubacterium sp.]